MFRDNKDLIKKLMEESLKDSAQIPLLESSVVEKDIPRYFNTNFFDTYLFFWVNRFVDVPLTVNFSI